MIILVLKNHYRKMIINIKHNNKYNPKIIFKIINNINLI